MKKSKILSLILCAVLVIAFASLDASAATDVQTKKVLGNSLYDGSVDLVAGVDKFVATVTDKGTVRTATTVTGASENDAEKAADDEYYKIYADQSGNYVVLEVLPQLSALNSDAFISFDFKLDDNSTINLFCVNNLYDSENKKYTTNYPQTQLGYISNKGGFYETGAQTILGEDSTKAETFVTADKFRAGKWNSVQIAICGKDNTFKMRVNGVEYNIPTQKTYTLSDKTYSLENGFYGISLKLNMTAGATAYLDNMYMQTGIDGAPLRSDEEFATNHGHIGEVEEYTLAVNEIPTITSAYGLDKIVDETILGKKKPDGTYYNIQLLGNSKYDRIYAPKGETVDEILKGDNIVIDMANADEEAKAKAKADIRFYADENRETLVTDVLPEICYAAVPVYDGAGRLRIYYNIDKEVSAGLFEHGGFKFNETNLYYSILGFNPTMTLDEVKAKLQDNVVVIPRTIGVNTVEGIAEKAFGSNVASGTFYPELDFDFSALTKQYFGAYCFAGSGITSVDLSDEGGADSYLFGNVFEGCTKLTDVKFGKGYKGGGGYAFKHCTALKTVEATDMPNYNWGGGLNQFNGCTALEKVVLGSTMKKYLPNEFLTGANYLQKIEVLNNGTIDTNYILYAAAYDTTGKMVGVSVLKDENSDDDRKTLNIPQGNKIKLFQLSKNGSLVPAVAATQMK